MGALCHHKRRLFEVESHGALHEFQFHLGAAKVAGAGKAVIFFEGAEGPFHFVAQPADDPVHEPLRPGQPPAPGGLVHDAVSDSSVFQIAAVLGAGVALVGKHHGAFTDARLRHHLLEFFGVRLVGRRYVPADDEAMPGVGGGMDLVAVEKLAGLFRPGGIGVIRVGGDYLNLLLFTFTAVPFFDDLAFARPSAGGDDGGIHDGSLFDDQPVIFKLLAQHVEKLDIQPPVQKMVAERQILAL